MNNNEKVYHITWTTYNSRVSERMRLYNVQPWKDWVFLDDEQEYQISLILWKIVKEIDLKVYAYNICNDHIHLLLQCREEDLNLIIRRLKWKSTKMYKDLFKIEDKINLWGQKFNRTIIENKIQLLNTIKYIKNNRLKHWLEINNKLEKVNFCTKVIT
jgi:REP element-mobilizing transposase RayT